jgi:hypothetical protein
MYLDSLPGIEIANIDGVASEQQLNFLGIWNDLQTTTVDTFREDVIQEFGKRYLLKQITQTVDLGKQIDINSLSAPVAGHQYGTLIETSQQGTHFAASNLQDIYIQTVNFFWSGSNSVPSLTLVITDADLGEILYTMTVGNAVPGWNQIWVDRQFSVRRLYIFISGNFDNYVKLDLSQFRLDNFTNLDWGFSGTQLYFSWFGAGCQARVRAVDHTVANNTDTISTNTFGVSVVMSIRCSYDTIVCSNRKHFASAWQHCLAIELLNYRLNSSRLNKWTTILKEQAQALQTIFIHKYRGGVDLKTGLEYPGKLQLAVTSIALNDADCCLKPNDALMWAETKF